MENKNNLDPNGVWMVSTEANEEGSRYTNLGVYNGRIDKIAFALADQAFWSLTFRRMDTSIPSPKELRRSVSIVLDEAPREDENRISFFKTLLKDTEVRVEKGQFYHSVRLERDISEEEIRERALAKLSDEEKTALGLV